MAIKAVIFDLDGVIVSTDECHYQAWYKLAAEENIYFDKVINMRLRGVSRMESLNILLEKSLRQYSQDEKVALAERKNRYYQELIKCLSPSDILCGVKETLIKLKEHGIKIAIASSSKNSPAILSYIGLNTYFDATVDGNDISNSKPNPEVFLIAAKMLCIKPMDCLVVEDSASGIEAALTGGMKVVGVGSAENDKRANCATKSLEWVRFEPILRKYM